MLRLRVLGAALACVLAAGFVLAGDPAPLATAHGVVEKVGKNTVSVRPRGAGGKFQPTLVLKVAGTSRFTTLTTRKAGGKTVFVQNESQAKDLQPKQPIAVIYTPEKTGGVLLTAVAQPAKAP
jgi:hypothetical protein